MCEFDENELFFSHLLGKCMKPPGHFREKRK